MKALVCKDLYVLWKQVKLLIILVLFFAFIPSTYINSFAVIYVAMLPYTALAYDERSKWDQLAAMMPYSIRDIVLSKYVLGWLCTVGAAVLSLLVQAVLHPLLHTDFAPTVILLAVCMAACILSIILPLMFRFGVEKARLLMMLLIILVCASAGALSDLLDSGVIQPTVLPGGFVCLLLAAAVLTAVSVPLSIRMYEKRMD